MTVEDNAGVDIFRLAGGRIRRMKNEPSTRSMKKAERSDESPAIAIVTSFETLSLTANGQQLVAWLDAVRRTMCLTRRQTHEVQHTLKRNEKGKRRNRRVELEHRGGHLRLHYSSGEDGFDFQILSDGLFIRVVPPNRTESATPADGTVLVRTDDVAVAYGFRLRENSPLAKCLDAPVPDLDSKITFHGRAATASCSLILTGKTAPTDISLNARLVEFHEQKGAHSGPSELKYRSSDHRTVFLKTTTNEITVKSNPSPGPKNVNVRIGVAELKWSPALHLETAAAVNSARWNIRNLFHIIKHGRGKVGNRTADTTAAGPMKIKKKLVNVLVEVEETVTLHAIATRGSRVDITGRAVSVHVEDTPGRNKPNVVFVCADTSVTCDNCQPALLNVDRFTFRDVWRDATSREISDYEALRTTFTDREDLVTDRDGTALHESLFIQAGHVVIGIGPHLQFGTMVEDLIVTPRALIRALVDTRSNHTRNPTLLVKTKPFLLMTVSTKIANMDVSLLEESSSPHGASVEDDPIFIPRLRAFLQNIQFSMERTSPPSHIQSCLHRLDEADPDNKLRYEAKGGFVKATVSNIVAILHPLTRETPLAAIDNLRWEGLFLLASPCPTTPRLKPPSVVRIPLHHFPSHDATHDSCGSYTVQMESRGVPTKVYLDGSLHTQKTSISFGMQVQKCIPDLLQIIRRLQLPPSEEAARQHQLPLSWWDNLRFWVHGDIFVTVKRFGFKWLLDDVTKDEWSVLVNGSDLHLHHAFGLMEWDMRDMILSVPSVPYDMGLGFAERFDTGYSNRRPFAFGRQPLLLIPLVSVDLRFSWSVTATGQTIEAGHHGPYTRFDSDDNMTENRHDDKYFLFRSHSVDLDIRSSLSGDARFTNWVALRIDAIPWLTHRPAAPPQDELASASVLANPRRDDEATPPRRPLPAIGTLSASASVTEIRAALWYGTGRADGLVCVVPSIAANGSSRSGDAAGGPSAGAVTNVEMKGFRAAPFDVSAASFDDDDDGTGGCERMFEMLQRNSSSELLTDYLVEIGDLAVVDRSLETLVATNASRESGATNGERKYCQNGPPQKVPWTVLVGEMKLLWTLNIRDAILLLVGDLLKTINFMTVRIKDSDDSTHEKPPTNISSSGRSDGSGAVPLKSHLSEVLGPSLGAGDKKVVEDGMSDSIPIIDIHLSNPQVQLHSKSTGGSIVFALKSAHVKGKDFLKLVELVVHPSSNHELISSEDFLRKTEFRYVLDNVEAFSVRTDVDVDAGLQWLRVVSDDTERCDASKPPFGESLWKDSSGIPTAGKIAAPAETRTPLKIDRNDNVLFTDDYFPGLSLFEPKEFAIPRLFRKILNTCTFSVRQVMHHPPSDLSRRELEKHRSRGASIAMDPPNDHPIMDHLGLELDELSFMLDSHQFNTAIDLIRHVFLAPPPVPRKEPVSKDRDGGKEDRPSKIEERAIPSDLQSDTPPLGDPTDRKNPRPNFLSRLRNRNAGPDPPAEAEFRDRDRDGFASAQVTGRGDVDDADASYRDDASGTVTEDTELSSLTEKISRILNGRNDAELGKKPRNALRDATESAVSLLEDRQTLQGRKIVRSIEWRLGKAKWMIRSDEFLDDVEVTFTELHGAHNFSADGGVSTQVDLEDLAASSQKPGPDSIGFFDPTTVLATALGAKRSSCQRCGGAFNRSENETGSCPFHADQNGRAGVYHKKSGVDGGWSCCGAAEGTRGCKNLPHTGLERVILMRLEALPRIVEGLTLYKHVEVNIFPSVPHTLIVQVTKSLAHLFMAYFMGEQHGSLGQTKLENSSSRNLGAASSGDTSPARNLMKKKLLFGGGGFSARNSSKSDSRMGGKAKISLSDDDTTDAKKERKGEIIFLKIWRIGHIKARVSYVAFPVVPDTTDLGIWVPAFSKTYKIGTFNYLGHKYLSHLIQEVLKSATSSGLGKIREKISGQTDTKSSHQSHAEFSAISRVEASKSDVAGRGSRSEDENRAKMALILGSPSVIATQKKKKNFFRMARNK